MSYNFKIFTHTRIEVTHGARLCMITKLQYGNHIRSLVRYALFEMFNVYTHTHLVTPSIPSSKFKRCSDMAKVSITLTLVDHCIVSMGVSRHESCRRVRGHRRGRMCQSYCRQQRLVWGTSVRGNRLQAHVRTVSWVEEYFRKVVNKYRYWLVEYKENIVRFL